MSLFSLQVLALLLTALLLGGMTFFSFLFAPLVFMRLPQEVAGQFIRHVFPFYYGVGAVLAVGATLAGGWRLSSLLLGIAGFGFLFALLWLMPSINRNRDKGLAGDAQAMAAFQGLHRASTALNAVQILLVLAAFALLATG